MESKKYQPIGKYEAYFHQSLVMGWTSAVKQIF